MGRFIWRCLVFVYVIYLYIFHRDEMTFDNSFFALGPFDTVFGKIVTLVIWAVLMIEMLQRMVPDERLKKIGFHDIGSTKQFKADYLPEEKFDEQKLRSVMKERDRGALKVLAVWFVLTAAVLALKITKLIGQAEILAIWGLCYFLDVFCILFFCPLQTLLMKNRCCVTCRIFRWDHFLVYTVLAFIPSFLTFSLFGVSLVELAIWEYNRYRYPERFWEGSNRNLRCANCKDRLCVHKKYIRVGEERRLLAGRTERISNS